MPSFRRTNIVICAVFFVLRLYGVVDTSRYRDKKNTLPEDNCENCHICSF